MNRVCQILGIEKQIIQAPMGWITTPKMMAAVSNAGGLGIFGSCAGFKKPITTVDDTVEEMRKTIHKTKKLTSKPFGMNISPKIDDPYGFSKATIKLCKEEGIKILALVGTHAPEDIKRLKNEGFTILYRQSNPTIKESIEAEKAGADIIMATGCDNGG
ncbi:inosine monophosphate dehydrogenase [Anaeromyces robustus]|uniref:Inosine monophosphate dehydrogenase n=1 Tax=Anaeromyces robustus TaxID=1754192 RepID=A0A1Y1XNK1_9FUNG|nr:inosine monophosphate dehydrogenase [Anaeromyces robustus]|eukprot:ORX87329.1 inosine monophosphate dehydrogenase [Anaeromyces robustus]